MKRIPEITLSLILLLCGAFLFFNLQSEPLQPAEKDSSSKSFQAPKPLRIEHQHLHEELQQAMQAGGKTGEAAKAVAKVMAPHFEEENQLALPPLGLLTELSQGKVTPEMKKVLPLTNKLKQKLPQMLEEHRQIKAALQKLVKAAEQENKPKVAEFANRLILHAQTEEQVLYPAAILVGDYVKLKLEDQK